MNKWLKNNSIEIIAFVMCVLLVLLVLTGCGTQTRQDTVTTESGQMRGTYAGQPLDVVYQRKLESGTDSKTDLKMPEIAAVGKLATGFATGDIAAIIGAITTLAGAGGLALAKHGEAKRARANEDQVYNDLMDLRHQTQATREIQQ